MLIMERRYDIHDLATAQVNAVRFAKKHPDLAEFHESRFRALALAFDIPDSAAQSDPGKDALESLAASSIRTLVGLHSPFSNFSRESWLSFTASLRTAPSATTSSVATASIRRVRGQTSSTTGDAPFRSLAQRLVHRTLKHRDPGRFYRGAPWLGSVHA